MTPLLTTEKILKQMGFFIVKEPDIDRFNPLLRPLDCENDAQARLMFEDFIGDNQFLAYKNISFRQNITKKEMGVVIYVMTYRDFVAPMVKVVATVEEQRFDYNYKLSNILPFDENYFKATIRYVVNTFFDKVISPWMLSCDFPNKEIIKPLEPPSRELLENFKHQYLGGYKC